MSLTEFVYTVLLKPKLLKNSANWLLKKIIPATVTVDGAIVHLNPDDPVISGALTLSVFERDEIALFRRLFRPDMTFLDVGANVGLYSALALATEGFDGKVVSMEPDEESAVYLQRTLEANRNMTSEERVILVRAAASDTEGTALLHKNPNNKGDNRLYSDAVLEEAQSVAVTTIDSVCLEHRIERVEFVKIDVQGAEGKAILGATSVLRNSSDCIILSELWPYGLSRCGSDLDSYVASLEALGFELFELNRGARLCPFNRSEVAARYTGRKYTNIVALKGKYLREL